MHEKSRLGTSDMADVDHAKVGERVDVKRQLLAREHDGNGLRRNLGVEGIDFPPVAIQRTRDIALKWNIGPSPPWYPQFADNGSYVIFKASAQLTCRFTAAPRWRSLR
jgi:hypothetical protein